MIRILDTDFLFSESPNPGEAGCKCSRCHRFIKENETVARNFLAADDLAAVNKQTGKAINLGDKEGLQGKSWEFRLCVTCNVKWLRKATRQSEGLAKRVVQKFPDSLEDQYHFIRKISRHN